MTKTEVKQLLNDTLWNKCSSYCLDNQEEIDLVINHLMIVLIDKNLIQIDDSNLPLRKSNV